MFNIFLQVLMLFLLLFLGDEHKNKCKAFKRIISFSELKIIFFVFQVL